MVDPSEKEQGRIWCSNRRNRAAWFYVALLALVGLGSLTEGLVAGIIPEVWVGTLGDRTLVPSDVYKEQERTIAGGDHVTARPLQHRSFITDTSLLKDIVKDTLCITLSFMS